MCGIFCALCRVALWPGAMLPSSFTGSEINNLS